jgi:hypothetical protein
MFYSSSQGIEKMNLAAVMLKKRVYWESAKH